MEINFQHGFKSYNIGDKFDIADFSVITGINGSGKSQLLEALREGKATISNSTRSRVAYFDTRSFKSDAEPAVHASSQMFNQQIWQEIRGLKADNRWAQLSDLKGNIGEDYEELIANLKQSAGSFALHLRSKGISTYDDWLEDMFPQNDAIQQSLYVLAQKLPYALDECDRYDVDTYVHGLLGSSSGLIPNLTALIWEYYVSFRNNQLNRFLRAEGQTDIKACSDDEFEEINGIRPWQVFNELIATYGLRYRIPSPEGRPGTDLYSLQLVDPALGVEVSLDALSSGEKALMALAGAAYLGSKEAKFPELVLLDEVDAYLHPSMIKSMFTVIERVFLKRKAKVILVTHSPTTVIMAPEASLHVIDAVSNPRVRKCSSQEALNLLGTGLPLLSVSMLDRRIVFTESEYDAAFYQRLHTILRSHLSSDLSLVFVASGLGGNNANSDEVKRIAGALAQNKLANIFGVIDYDDKNRTTSNVKVLAEGLAYTLENVLLDPVCVAIYLRLLEKIDAESIGLLPSDSISDFESFQQEKLQYVADSILRLYGLPTLLAGERVKWEYMNGRHIELPRTFLMSPGHPIVESVAAVPALQAIFAGNKSDPLQRKIPKVFLEYPGFIPVALTNLMLSLVSTEGVISQ